MPDLENKPQGNSIFLDFDLKPTNPFDGVKTVDTNLEVDSPEEERDTVVDDVPSSDDTDISSGGQDTDSHDEEGDDDTQEIVKDEDEPSLYYYVQQELKKDGFIDSELEFDEKVDGMTVYTAYKESMKKKIEPTIREEIHQAAMEDGYDPNDLIIARAFRQGVDHRLLSDASRFEIYSRLDDQAPDEDKTTVISQMYRDRGFNDAEIKKLLAKAEEDEEVNQLFTDSRTYFGNKYQQFVEKENERVEQLRQQQLADARKAEELLKKVVSSQEILGEKLTPAQAKEIDDAVRLQSEVVEVDGTKHRVSELQKFIMDFMNDPEFRLYQFKMHKYRNTDKDQVKNDAKKEVEQEFLAGYKQRIVKSNKISRSKEVIDELKNKEGSSKSIFWG